MSSAETSPGGVAARGLTFNEPLIFEQGGEGRAAFVPPAADVPALDLAATYGGLLRSDGLPGFPQVSAIEVVRHFTRLSQWNFSVDSGFYPLGSCTMKLNPKINEAAAALPGFAGAHPLSRDEQAQGTLQLLSELADYLCAISGMAKVSLQPAAGAHGELVGMLMIRAALTRAGNPRRTVLLPASAHGTNSASSALCGYEVIELPCGPRGYLEAAEVARRMSEEVAALMITNPNTLGLFEAEIAAICDLVHERGGFVYCDGANLNALMGLVRPGDTGVDVLHFNLHKTFSTPHGGGGPGAGPVGVSARLADYLPTPLVERVGERYALRYDVPHSIGRVRAFFGNVGVLLRAYAYIRAMGGSGLAQASADAVLNANYVRARLRGAYALPYDRPCLHECVFTDARQAPHGVTTLDIAKRLMDYGYHPPTVYFPLIVKAALMIEPTETETVETLDGFIDAMLRIARECAEQPQLLHEAPHLTRLSRLDETAAARRPQIRWLPST
ncbi:MAG: aminomethyl-transferring glycine dehydrogenase subunit GcvPB [Candidatus Tectomicrobia bacterium]|nr:aminomethyl-transferring glycine dehydrogenase subunit GcvPB [Candidatus Tectomicrobia bacterium]